ncbi:MAG: NYN domain-containing protein [Vicinamibacterales bacterium]
MRKINKHCSFCQGRTQAAAVIDLDNLVNRGPLGPRALLDITRLAAAFRNHHVVTGTVCQHWRFRGLSESIWRGLNFDLVAAGANCDRDVSLALIQKFDAGFRHLILVAGDHGYADLVTLLRKCGAWVEIWTLREAAAYELVRAADAVRFIDGLITEVAPPSCAA